MGDYAALQSPELVDVCRQRVQGFIDDEGRRSAQRVPSVGDVLALLTVLDIPWSAAAGAVASEVLHARGPPHADGTATLLPAHTVEFVGLRSAAGAGGGYRRWTAPGSGSYGTIPSSRTWVWPATGAAPGNGPCSGAP